MDIKNSVKDDDILADILGEIKEEKPEEAEATGKAEKVIAPAKIAVASRKSDAAAAKEYMNSFLNNIKVQEQERKKAEASSDHEMLERILKPKATMPNKKVATTFSTSQIKKEPVAEGKEKKKETPSEDPFSDNDMDFSCLDDDENQFDLEKEKPKEESKPVAAEKIPEKAVAAKEVEPTQDSPEDMSKLLSNWESICQMDDDFEKSVLAADQTESESSTSAASEQQLRFWYWEAWEDPLKLPGEVFLFGRTADGKSVCVRVQNINRVLYLLPRQFVSTLLR